jgi:RNA polymerase sigma-70 factor (ECF subfamily)
MSVEMSRFLVEVMPSIRWAACGYPVYVTVQRFDEAEFAARVGRRDESALEAIYREYGGAVGFLARKVLGNEALAEDVVQDVFVSFWKAPDRFDPDRGSLRTYLLTVTHRRAVDLIRSEEARSRREDRSPTPEATPGIEDEVMARYQRESVRQAVAGLNEDEREAISLAYFEGLTYAEVARRIGAPEGTVKSRIRTGMKKLSTSLGEVPR